MAEREVIQEFLAKLGFQVDQPTVRNFLGVLRANCVSAAKLGATLAGVTVAAEAMVTKFARGMEKLYYASKTTGSAAENIQALEYGVKQIGLEADDARSMLEGMGKALRMTPYLRGVLKSLGVESEGRDNMEVMLDLVEKLQQRFRGPMGHAIGAGFAEMFGINERQFLLLKQQLPELRRFIAQRKQMNRDMGVDTQAAAEAGKEYMQGLRELWERLIVAGQRLAIELLPVFRELNAQLKEIVVGFTKWLGSDEGRNAINATVIHFKALGDVIGGIAKEISLLKSGKFSEANKVDEDVFDTIMYMLGVGPPTDRIQKLIDLAGRGKGNLGFPAGAPGPTTPAAPHAQMPDLGPIGLDRQLSPWQRNNLQFLFNELMSGRWKSAGRSDIVREMNQVLGAEPRTWPFTARLGTSSEGGMTLQFDVKNNISVSGVSDPNLAAREVARQQKRTLGDAVRNSVGAVR